MEAIKQIIDGNILSSVMDLPSSFLNRKIEILAYPMEEKIASGLAVMEKHKKYLEKKPTPVLGCAKGKMWFADDFDAPLEGFEEYM